MANPAWPPELPQVPLLQGYSETPADRRLSFRPDVGPAIMRQRADFKYAAVAGPFAMSGFQVVVFETFWDVTTAGGTLPFDWIHPRKKSEISVIFDPESPPPSFGRIEAPDLYTISLRFRVIADTAGVSFVLPLWI